MNDFDYALEEPSPSPGYNPSTPGYQMNTPFTPHTPGTLYGSEYSPYQPSPSPSPSPYQVNYMGTPSPTGYSPATPGGAPQSPYNPQTPGAGLADSHGEWCTTDLEVKIHSVVDSDLAGQTGIIRTVNNGACAVFLPEEDRVVTVLSENLEPVLPQPKDHFKLIYGEDRETTGVLLSAHDKDATVLINGSKKFLPMHYLCKMKAD